MSKYGMCRSRLGLPIAASLLMVWGMPFSAEAQVKVSLAQLPKLAESPDAGILVQLVKAMDEVLGRKSTISVVPFPRSIKYVVTGEALYHLPLLEEKSASNNHKDFALTKKFLAFEVPFVLYARIDKGITTSNVAALARDGKIKVATDTAHTQFFDFPVTASTCLECSLKQIEAGRMDALIFAMKEVDSLLRPSGLKKISRQLYKVYNVRAVVPLGPKGEQVDEELNKAVTELKKTGKYQKIMAPLLEGYEDWQPAAK